jgi:excisionase family DNA binding protein
MAKKRSDKDKLTYEITEAAQLLGVGRNQAYEAAHRGELPVIRIGKRYLIPKAALDRMLAGETPKPQAKAAAKAA